MRRAPLNCRLLVGLVGGLFGAGPVAAQPALHQALTTVRLLSGLVDSRLVRFDVPAPGADAPVKVYSVALAFDRTWWLYTPGLGTRPLGPAPHDLKLTPAEITARLHAVSPALAHIEVIANPVHAPLPPNEATLRNGCFAGCLLYLTRLYLRGEPVEEAGIIFLADDPPSAPSLARALGDIGHSLLVYRVRDRWNLLDPASPEEPLPFHSPQIGAEIDPDLAACARRGHYPTRHVEYLRFSSTALDRLAGNVAWVYLRPVATPTPDP